MSAEAIRGPLPSHFEIIFRSGEGIDNKGTSNNEYIDRGTGSIQLEDPRLGPLPKGWQKVNGGGDHCAMFVKDGSGNEPTDEDPRLTQEALKERGVDLKVFELV
jgi:hypothetical protein